MRTYSIHQVKTYLKSPEGSSLTGPPFYLHYGMQEVLSEGETHLKVRNSRNKAVWITRERFYRL